MEAEWITGFPWSFKGLRDLTGHSLWKLKEFPIQTRDLQSDSWFHLSGFLSKCRIRRQDLSWSLILGVKGLDFHSQLPYI